LENFLDAHATYVHRNSANSIWNRSLIQSRTWAKPEVVNGRALVNARGVDRRAPAQAGASGAPQARPKLPWRLWYSRGQFYWPRTEYRRLWVWAFAWRGRRRAARPTVVEDREWQAGLHLPSMVRLGGGGHQFSRWAVPINDHFTRIWWFHSIRPQNRLAAVYERIQFTVWNDWSRNFNFNGGDARQEIYQYYDKPEKLSVSDVWTIAWRKLQMQARGMPDYEIEGVPEAEEFSEFEPVVAQEKPAQMAQTGGGA
jgi:hypothetical protein